MERAGEFRPVVYVVLVSWNAWCMTYQRLRCAVDTPRVPHRTSKSKNGFDGSDAGLREHRTTGLDLDKILALQLQHGPRLHLQKRQHRLGRLLERMIMYDNGLPNKCC